MITASAPRASANVTLLYFRATARSTDVLVAWETATEITTTGYYVRRGLAEAGPFQRVGAFVAARGDGLVGAAYSLVDRPPASGLRYYYQLEEIESNQTTVFHGPTTVFFGPTPSPTAAAPTPTSPRGATVAPTHAATSVPASSPTSLPIARAPSATAKARATSRPDTRAASTAAPTQAPAGAAPTALVHAPVLPSATQSRAVPPPLASSTVPPPPAGPGSAAVTESAVVSVDSAETEASGAGALLPAAVTAPTWTPGAGTGPLAMQNGPAAGDAPERQDAAPAKAPMSRWPLLLAATIVVAGLLLAGRQLARR